MIRLVSFDIDGTLETGDPPGIVTLDFVRKTRDLGYLIGSCSDRPVSFQVGMWAKHGIGVDFTVLKHQLDDVKARFPADEYYHIGDTDMDRFFAGRAGFEFVEIDDISQLWTPDGMTS